MKDQLDERAQQVLRILIEQYIGQGVPVASSTVAQDKSVSCSPATIRNIMSLLEEKGYLLSPHTSAGRIPTPRAYRVFVDQLISIKPLESDDLSHFESNLCPSQDKDALLKSATTLLSELTHFAGLVTLPKHNAVSLRQVEFLSLSGNRVLTILVVNDSEVQNRIIHTERKYAQTELNKAANFINHHYAGINLSLVRKQINLAIQQDRQKMDVILKTAAEMTDKAFEQSNEPLYHISGQGNLLDLLSVTNPDQLRDLLDAFSQKQAIMHLMDQFLHADGLKIFIGEESGYSAFDECGIVASPYTEEGETVGMLGVIGPTRMPYDKVISIVDATAKILSSALNYKNTSPHIID
jgi:heat-inducible transcriptional repressor